MSDIMRKRFYDVLSESVNDKQDNNFYLTSERYNSVLREAKEAKCVKGKQTVHHWRLKRYDILDKLTVPLSAEKTEILYYVTFDELFNVHLTKLCLVSYENWELLTLFCHEM
jgi:hypothetical protein